MLRSDFQPACHLTFGEPVGNVYRQKYENTECALGMYKPGTRVYEENGVVLPRIAGYDAQFEEFVLRLWKDEFGVFDVDVCSQLRQTRHQYSTERHKLKFSFEIEIDRKYKKILFRVNTERAGKFSAACSISSFATVWRLLQVQQKTTTLRRTVKVYIKFSPS